MSSTQGTEQDVNRGAAEDAAGAPVTETDFEVAQRPPSDPGDDVVDDAAGAAGGASGGGGGTSGMPGHPDAAQGDR
jgi:hypothetical protein